MPPPEFQPPEPTHARTQAQREELTQTALLILLTSDLDGMVAQRRAPADLPPGTTAPVQIEGDAWWAQGHRKEKNDSPPPEFQPQTVQPVASRHTDEATQGAI